MNADENADHLFFDYRYLCGRGARKFLRDGLERSDLEQVAAIGLVKACRRYDGGTGTPFEAFAWLMVVGELMHFVRDYERLIRFPRSLRRVEKLRARAHETLIGRLGREPSDSELAVEMGVSPCVLDELDRATFATVPSLLEESKDLGAVRISWNDGSIEDRLALEQALSALPAIERRILVGIYRLGLTQAEVARSVALSPRHVSRLHRKALDAMRAAIMTRERGSAPRSP